MGTGNARAQAKSGFAYRISCLPVGASLRRLPSTSSSLFDLFPAHWWVIEWNSGLLALCVTLHSSGVLFRPFSFNISIIIMSRQASSKLRGLATMSGMLAFIGAVVSQMHTLKYAL